MEKVILLWPDEVWKTARGRFEDNLLQGTFPKRSNVWADKNPDYRVRQVWTCVCNLIRISPSQ